MASSMVIAPPFDPFFSMSRDMSLSVTAAVAPSLCTGDKSLSARYVASISRSGQRTPARHLPDFDSNRAKAVLPKTTVSWVAWVSLEQKAATVSRRLPQSPTVRANACRSGGIVCVERHLTPHRNLNPIP